MSPIVIEINEDKIYKDMCCGESYAMFFLLMLKKRCRASKYFKGPVDAIGPKRHPDALLSKTMQSLV